MLQQLREDGLITLKGKTLTILDLERLKEFADFDPNYLHLNNSRNNFRRGNNGGAQDGIRLSCA